MTTMRILGNEISLEFVKGVGAVGGMDEAEVTKGAEEMAKLINGREWPPEYAAAFQCMKGIVFFDGKIIVNNYEIERPCCDEDDAIFYWEVKEFMFNPDADVRANTFFHDCWHVVQFRQAGNRFYRNEEERLAREVEAIEKQIEVAALLGCSDKEIAFLKDFKKDQEKLRQRFAEGVGRWIPHKPRKERATEERNV